MRKINALMFENVPNFYKPKQYEQWMEVLPSKTQLPLIFQCYVSGLKRMSQLSHQKCFAESSAKGFSTVFNY